ncbi:MAG: histidinol-phosphate transaminase [Acidisphaera sp.]|nr:histidinol-phosphate transaminase [Acidisphaera sp.]MBV9812166.1 histidinol-phosphate transaminase [Acetobacteraceae bacterium]
MTVKPRAEVLAIRPYVGGESHIPGANRTVKLSSNEGAFGAPPAARAAYAAAADGIHRYPDGHATALRAAIGRRFGLDPERIVCGAGSDDILYQLCLCYGGPGTDILMSMHGFSLYQIAGTYAGSRVLKVPERNLTADIDALLAAVTPATRLLFLANPNNPTGSLLPAAEVRRLRAGLRSDVLLILDAAYAEYVTRADYDPGVELVDAGDNTVMTRTFSKIFGLGGMRLGWCYAPPAVVDVLNRARSPFNVNLAVQAAGMAALAEPGWVERSASHNAEWRERLSDALRGCGLTVWPSEGNFVLAEFADTAEADAADAFLRRRGIIVRNVRSYDLPHCLRITVGTQEECTAVADALAEFVMEPSRVP